MLLVRDIMYCKPGKVRPMVEKFVAISKLGEKKVEVLPPDPIGELGSGWSKIDDKAVSLPVVR